MIGPAFNERVAAELAALHAELAQANDVAEIVAREAARYLREHGINAGRSGHALTRLRIATGEWRRRGEGR